MEKIKEKKIMLAHEQDRTGGKRKMEGMKKEEKVKTDRRNKGGESTDIDRKGRKILTYQW